MQKIIFVIALLVGCGKNETTEVPVPAMPKQITVSAYKNPIPYCNGGGSIKITGLDANQDSVLDEVEISLFEVECDLVGIITYPIGYDCHLIGNGFICKIKKDDK